MKKVLFLFLFSITNTFAQNDSTFIKQLYNNALSNGHAYENLRYLCKNIGARLSGSAQAQMAVEWSERLLRSYQFDTVYLQPVEVPYWVRGSQESGWIKNQNNQLHKVNMLALGGSIGTNGILEGTIIEYKHLDDLKKASEKEVKGKIVFLNQAMNEQEINTMNAYGGCYAIRSKGTAEAARLGAKAIIIRSIGLVIDEHPHTGVVFYPEGIEKIPAAAISTKDAEYLSKHIKNSPLQFVLEMNCEDRGTRPSFNVIAELKGKSKPNNIITVGGHLDSWDIGEGAHDDGAGVMHSIEALRLLKIQGYKPNNTLRVVLFMNEENGNQGGEGYAKWVFERKENHIAAIESDRGGFSPRGFSLDGSKSALKSLKSYQNIYKPYDVHYFEPGYGGVDINPLKDYFPKIDLYGFAPDSQRYFDFHHAPSDVFENVNKRELELGCATIASLMYLLDKENK